MTYTESWDGLCRVPAGDGQNRFGRGYPTMNRGRPNNGTRGADKTADMTITASTIGDMTADAMSIRVVNHTRCLGTRAAGTYLGGDIDQWQCVSDSVS